jgi:hypothetical protein
VVRPRSYRVIYYFDTPTLGKKHQSFGRVIDHIERLQTNIVETLWKIEMIFPPSFFDSMEHLHIHLPFEAKAGGPVQYRWMYPFERLDITVAM